MDRVFGFIPFAKRLHPQERVGNVVHRPLAGVMAFTGRSIDDIVNSPIVKNEVLGYFKLQRFVQRRTEIVELEQQWNAIQ